GPVIHGQSYDLTGPGQLSYEGLEVRHLPETICQHSFLRIPHRIRRTLEYSQLFHQLKHLRYIFSFTFSDYHIHTTTGYFISRKNAEAQRMQKKLILQQKISFNPH